MSGRNGVEIGYCPKCRGVWFDRGELDTIIERSGVSAAAVSTPRIRSPQHGYRMKKKESFLGELFDFQPGPLGQA